ncbi:MAG: hypothetical protein U0T56_12445 [Ferruginibacter sp.]
MNIVKLLFELFIIYLLYKLVFELIIPLFNATWQMKHKMADMQEQRENNRIVTKPWNQANGKR